MQNQAIEIDEKPKYSRNDRWSIDGLQCHQSGANCDACTLFLNYRMHKHGFGDSKCHQPKANAALLASGVPFPVEKKAEPLNEKRQPKCTPEQIVLLLEEILVVVKTIGNPTMRQIADHLSTQYDGGGFMGRTYNFENMHTQVSKLLKTGKIIAEKRKCAYYYSVPGTTA